MAEKQTPPASERPSEVRKPSLDERVEGIQGWMAEMERRQGRMMYFGAAACVLAALAAAAALYIALSTQSDSATKDDVDQLQEQVTGIQQQVKRATETQLKGVNETLGSLDQRVEDLKQKQAQDAKDITALEEQVAANARAAAAGGGGTGAGGAGTGTGGGGAAGGDRRQPGP
jgi:TolA-binding protein